MIFAKKLTKLQLLQGYSLSNKFCQVPLFEIRKNSSAGLKFELGPTQRFLEPLRRRLNVKICKLMFILIKFIYVYLRDRLRDFDFFLSTDFFLLSPLLRLSSLKYFFRS